MNGKIVVLGSFVVDLSSISTNLPIPGQTVLGTSFKAGPGGKGSNQAVAAHRAGADILLITKIGNDSFGKIATDFYQQENMPQEGVLTDEDMSTGAALIMVDSTTGQNMITVVPGACAHFTAEDIEICRPYIASADFLLLQFEINMDAIEKAIRIASENNTRIILNPAPAAPISDLLLSMIDTVTPNETEVWAMTGIQIRKQEDMIHAAEYLQRRGVKNVVITLGDNGVFVSDGSRYEHYAQIPVRAVDTTGAGDSFNGCFVAYGDSGYLGLPDRPEIKADENLSRIKFRINRRPSSLNVKTDYDGINWEKVIEHQKSAVRCKVEHPFLIVKRQFGYCKTAYRGIAKDMNRFHMLFGCANLLMCIRGGRAKEFCSVCLG